MNTQIMVKKLYSFIAKLIILLEDELQSYKPKTAMNVKKNLTDTLNKLVNLIVQLKKLEEDNPSYKSVAPEDKKIIDRFISKL